MEDKVEAPDIAPQQLRVGDLLVLADRLQVRRGDETLALTSLSFDLLLALARAAPRFLTFDELMHQVWPGLVVGTDTISQRVKLLREALGDDPKSPRYIAGVRGRGYRCIAAVSIFNPAGIPEPVRPPPTLSTRRWKLAGAMGSLVIALGAAYLLLRQMPSRALASVPVAVLPFESPGGAETDRVLAFGIAESLLHQLADVPGLTVIARASSFRVARENADTSAIARQFGVDYVLLGSVQREAKRIRITARLVEGRSGHNLWSLRFDRDESDLLVVQDQIALQVARALKVSTDPLSGERMQGQGTHSIEAYLEFLAGSDALATWRTGDAGKAAAHFELALRSDPKFARAWVMRAYALLRDAEFSLDPGARERYEQVHREVGPMVDRALALDPDLGDAYVQRARLRRSHDFVAAEQDYRHAIALTPSNAAAYQELAALVWSDRSRRQEAAALLDRARVLDPLSPEHDVTRAVYEFYGFAHTAEAEALLREVLQRHPDYVPALARLGEVLLDGSLRLDEAVVVLEQALRLDPGADWIRRLLVVSRSLAGDLTSATNLAQQSGASAANSMIVALARRELGSAVRLAHEALDSGGVSGAEQSFVVEALVFEAREGGDYATAGESLEGLLGLQWTDGGKPVIVGNPGLLSDVAAYAGLLRDAGKPEQSARVLALVDQELEALYRESGMWNRWLVLAKARSAALHNDEPVAMSMLEHYCTTTLRCWFDLTRDPLFEPLRTERRFQELLSRVEKLRAAARSRLSPA